MCLVHLWRLNMNEVMIGILVPFLGTSLGSACVFFMKKNMSDYLQRALTGFAAGVMVAASIWSLLLPAIEQSASMGKFSFVPAVVGFWIGILFLLLVDSIVPHLHRNSEKAEGIHSKLQRTTMLVLAVTIHNIPEGMAVGVVYAGYLSGNTTITAMGAFALSLGIAIQNFPEGAIISMPLCAEGINHALLSTVYCRELWSRSVRFLQFLQPVLLCRHCRICSVLRQVPCCMWSLRN